MKSSTFFKLFPPPKFLEMPYAGIDISDTSVHCLMYRHTRHGIELDRFGTKPLPKGAIEAGVILDEKAVVEAVRSLANELKVTYVKASLPEERMYLFKTQVPFGTAAEIHENIALRLEENVPLPAAEAVFYFDLIRSPLTNNHHTASVSVAPRKLVESYLTVLDKAGLITMSFENVPKSLAHAIVRDSDTDTKLIVHGMDSKVGFYIVDEGLVLFTSTMTLSNANSDNMTNTVDEVKKELSRVSSYWNEHGESGDEIKEIIFCGSKVNEITKALESDKGRETLLSVANVWINAFDLNRYVPTITKTDSLEYAVAAGLALPSHR